MIVDDEPVAIDNLSLLLAEYCNVKVCCSARSAADALDILQKQHPDILFLDIQMPGKNGIELAREVSKQKIPIVFVTAYDHYALQALKASAVDYLLKPAKIAELQAAVNKVRSLRNVHDHQPMAMETLTSNLDEERLHRIMVPWDGGFKVVDLQRVSLISSDNSYSEFHLEDEKLIVSKSIGEFESLLIDSGFYRVHNQYLINLSYLDSYSSKDGGQALLKGGVTIPISRRRLSGFKEATNSYFTNI